MSKSREYQSLNKMFRTGLHLEFQVDAYYGLNPTPQLEVVQNVSTRKVRVRRLSRLQASSRKPEGVATDVVYC